LDKTQAKGGKEGTGYGRRLRNEKLRDSYSCTCLIWVIKSRKTIRTRNVARVEEEKFIQDFDKETRRERKHLEGLGLEGEIILKLVIKKQNVREWNGLIWLGILTSIGPLWKS
jgi:hypothetical protein